MAKLIHQTHEADQIKKGDYFAQAGEEIDGYVQHDHWLVADSLDALMEGAKKLREEGKQVHWQVYQSLTDPDDDEQQSREITGVRL